MNNKMMLRIYSLATQKKMEELYKKQGHLFKSANEFVSLLVAKGIDKMNNDLGYSQEKSISELNVDLKELKHNFEEYKKQSGLSLFRLQENVNALLKVCGSNYHIAVCTNENRTVNKDYLEAGLYDEPPARILSEIRRKQNEE